MPKLRYQPPDRLIGATDFSKDDALRGSLNAVRLVKSQPWAWGGLREACAALESGYARKREPGHWELAAVAFVTSRHVDIQPWWDESSDDVWRECGFSEKPPYLRVWRRLRELEQVCDEFLSAAALVIQRCRMHDERVMAHVHFDFTEDETHAALVHDCQPGDNCKRRHYKTRSGRWHSRHGHALRPPRLATSEARKEREEWNEQDPAESVQHAAERAPEKEQPAQRGQHGRRVRVGGCWYRTRDEQAGVRAYTTGNKVRRFWHGYYSGKAIDHFTGGAIPTVDAADRQEYDLFPAFYDRVRNAIGEAPQTVIADRGFSVESCFKHATTNGTAPVFPWRQTGSHPRHDKPTHDRHGVMRCKHCGGTMYQTRYAANNGKPRLWFRCTFQLTPDCAPEQTISCSTDWRSLIPLPRTNALYHELKESHQTYEGVHDYWRDRYRVASDTLANRPKVVSLDWHRLRANVACLVDWMRIAAKAGWLGSVRSARRHDGARGFKSAGRRAAKNLAKTRARQGLYSPYGPGAKKRGGDETPPSRRPRGAPPGA